MVIDIEAPCMRNTGLECLEGHHTQNERIWALGKTGRL